ncbi:LPXTG-motif cell wall anchor domain-containing protein [Actinokineospora alba]|uniref:LPXTG-motif cell wall anchor domain-containing protein n=1 Tax=Actinokineospora alba TaxID=504798 RepID=A0A1H0T753_9PSEU|nr:LPXTG-motif cell wall anchor domain-containing protein [Actinokineospora alba]
MLALLMSAAMATTAAAQETDPVSPSAEPTATESAVPTSTPDPTSPEATTTEPAPTTTESSPSETSTDTTTSSESTSSSAPATSTSTTPSQPAKAAAQLPNVGVTASFDKAEYVTGDDVRVTVRITNNSDVDAKGVRAYASGHIDNYGQWGDLGQDGGATIPARGVREVTITGAILGVEGGEISFAVNVVVDGGDADQVDNFDLVSAPVAPAKGRFGGMIYSDHNGNGAFDSGEGITGVQVGIQGGVPYSSDVRYTDSAGRFDFGELNAGGYSVSYSAHGYSISGVTGSDRETLNIGGDRYAAVKLLATRSLDQFLGVNMRLDKTTYAVGDTVSTRVTLTNRGPQPLSGVTASCGMGSSIGGGVGWGDLATGGPGVSVPAGHSVVVSVTDVVPESAGAAGFLSASCSFLAAGYSTSGVPRAEASARVSGALGSGHGSVRHAPDGGLGAAVAGVKVLLLDEHTGATVAETVSDSEGEFRFSDLPVGIYDVRTDGPWVVTSYNRFPIRADGLGGAYLFVQPDEAGQGRLANLKVSVSFDRDTYTSDQPVKATVTVTNIGSAAAKNVRLLTGPSSNYWPETGGGWGELEYSRGTTVEAGQTRTFEFVGNPMSMTGDSATVVFEGGLLAEPQDMNRDNNSFFVQASVTKVVGEYSGMVFADKNGNGSADEGEGLSGVQVSATGGRPLSMRSTTTDADGRFAFDDLRAGQYAVYFSEGAHGWIPLGESGDGYDRFTLTAEGRKNVAIRAVRPLTDVLSGTFEFTADSYKVGESAKAMVTLTNSGTAELKGVRANCWSGDGYHDNTKGWFPIGHTDPGADLEPSETRTFEVADIITDFDRELGYHDVGCEFVANGHPDTGAPRARDSVLVLGALGTRSGELVHDANGDWEIGDDERLAGVKVQLVNMTTDEAIAETRTDAAGRFTFSDVQAGRYRVHVVGPWAFKWEGDGRFYIFAGESEYDARFFMVPGPEQPELPIVKPVPTEPTPVPGVPTPGVPAPQAGVAPTASTGGDELAQTGASVLGLTVLGLAVLMAGGITVMATKRRRTY